MTRNRILKAAAQIFSEKGYHAASMQDIADAVHLRKPSLYYHVASKQEILLALLDEALDLLIQQISEIGRRHLSPEAKLRLAIQTYIETIMARKDLSAVLLLEHRSLDLQQKAEHVLKRDEFENLWKLMIAEGIRTGDFICKDVSIAAKAILGMMNWSITWYRKGGSLSPRALASQYADLILAGLIPRDGKNSDG